MIVLAASQAVLAAESASEEEGIGPHFANSILHQPFHQGASASSMALKVLSGDVAALPATLVG